MFVNDSYYKTKFLGPMCPDAVSNSPLFGGLQYLLLEYQSLIIIYAYGPYYDIDIDLVVSESFCAVLMEPVLRCPFNVHNYQSARNEELATTQYRGKNYLFRCAKLRRQDHIMVDLFRSCLTVQVATHALKQSYNLEILSHMKMHLDCKFPGSYLHLSKVQQLRELLLHMTNNALETTKIQPKNSRVITHNDLTYLSISHDKLIPYEHITYMAHLFVKSRESSCADIAENSSVALDTTDTFLVLLLTITNYCGKTVYTRPAVHMSRYRIRRGNNWRIMYVQLKMETCSQKSQPDALTFYFRNIFSHSVVINSNITLKLQLHDLTVNFVYEKYKPCTSVEFQYRVDEMLTLPLSVRVSSDRHSFVKHLRSRYVHHYLNTSSWKTAQRHCQRSGMNLWSINSHAEWTSIYQMIGHVNVDTGRSFFQLEIGIPTISLVYLQDNQKYVHT